MDTLWDVISGVLLIARLAMVLAILVWTSLKLRTVPAELLQLRFFGQLKRISGSLLAVSLGIVTGIIGVMPAQLELGFPDWWALVFAIPSTIFMAWGVLAVYLVIQVPRPRPFARTAEQG